MQCSFNLSLAKFVAKILTPDDEMCFESLMGICALKTKRMIMSLTNDSVYISHNPLFLFFASQRLFRR